MQLSNKDLQIILNTLIHKFQSYSYIDNNFIKAIICSFLDNLLTINGKPYVVQEQECHINPCTYVTNKVENYLYYFFIIIQAPQIDSQMIDILLKEKKSFLQALCQKYNLANAKSFLKEVLPQYEASMSLEAFLEEQAKLLSSLCSTKHIQESSSLTEELLPIKEPSNVNSYTLCCNIVGEKQGSGTYDEFVQLGRRLKILNALNSGDDTYYEMYVLLRFGFINGSIFTKKEIAQLTNQSILNIIKYEKKTAELLKTILDDQFTNYEKYLLTKSFQ